jgi:hypothetical protein
MNYSSSDRKKERGYTTAHKKKKEVTWPELATTLLTMTRKNR